eukprot:Nk52_evm39s226 gene=Nk52_evmTU39s226
MVHGEEKAIPVIDFSPFMKMAVSQEHFIELNKQKQKVVQALDLALLNYGCFAATADLVDEKVTNGCFDVMREFFKSQEGKPNPTNAPGSLGYNGYSRESSGKCSGIKDAPNDPVYQFSMTGCGVLYSEEDIANDFGMEVGEVTAEEDGDVMNKSFHNTPFPSDEVKDSMSEAYRMGSGLADLILKGLAMALGMDEAYFTGAHKYKGYMRSHYFPKTTRSAMDTCCRFGAHTDMSSVTLLRTKEDFSTLQVQLPDETWITVRCDHPRAYFVNLGDIMVRYSNKKWRSVPHRVIWGCDVGEVVPERQSMPFFIYPKSKTLVDSVPTLVANGEKKHFEPETVDEIMSARIAVLFHQKGSGESEDEAISIVREDNKRLNSFYEHVEDQY